MLFFGCDRRCFREFPAEKYSSGFSSSVGASLPSSKGKRDSWGETRESHRLCGPSNADCHVGTVEISLSQPGFWSFLWPAGVWDGALAMNISELSINSCLCSDLTCTQSSQIWGTLYSLGRNESCSSPPPPKNKWAGLLWRGICRD